jgi:hypothetical protein
VTCFSHMLACMILWRCRSGCNAATAPGEKLEHETLDLLLQAMRFTAQRSDVGLSLWKADIDSAFRRIPIKPEHRAFAWICFKYNGHAVAARHLALMFGSVASVHHWERVGADGGFHVYVVHGLVRARMFAGELITAIARRVLFLPVLRFVDDYFAAEREDVARHAMRIFAR